MVSADISDEKTQDTGRHVLVLDDEPKIAVYLGRLLEMHGYQATTKTDSQEVLSLFQEGPNKFAMLVTDQTMPGLTGVELIKQLREIRPELPVILSSGYSEVINADIADDMGICYLDKPIDSKQLVRLVGELLA